MAIRPISADILEETEKWLLYGKAGTGKTHAALTAPEPIFFLSVGGTNEAKTYFSKAFQQKHGKKEIFIDAPAENHGKRGRVKEAEGFDLVCDSLDDALEADDKGEMEWATLIIDNATVLSAMQMYKIIQISSQSRVRDSNKTPGLDTYQAFIKQGILTPFDSDYNGVMSLMQQWVSWIFSLEKNVVFIAHEYEQTTQNRRTHSSDLIGVKPQFIGKNRMRISNLFDNVWRFERNAQLFEARTTSQGKPFDIVAKTRIGGVIPDNYSDVDLLESFKLMQKQARDVAV